MFHFLVEVTFVRVFLTKNVSKEEKCNKSKNKGKFPVFKVFDKNYHAGQQEQ